MPKKGIFNWSEESYTVQALESMFYGANKSEMKAIREEYTRLRDIAHKRVSRLGKSEFKKSVAYTSHVTKKLVKDPDTGAKKVVVTDNFPKLSEMDPRNIPKAMAEMYKFLSAKTSTVSGQRSRRRKTIESWQKQGLNLNEKNYNKVMALMKEMRSRKILYGSDKVISLVEASMEKRWNFNKVINSNELDKLLANADQVGEIPKSAGSNLDEYVRRVTGW